MKESTKLKRIAKGIIKAEIRLDELRSEYYTPLSSFVYFINSVVYEQSKKNDFGIGLTDIKIKLFGTHFEGDNFVEGFAIDGDKISLQLDNCGFNTVLSIPLEWIDDREKASKAIYDMVADCYNNEPVNEKEKDIQTIKKLMKKHGIDCMSAPKKD